jgi:hypothetical protein
MPIASKYREQFARLQRSYQRFTEIAQGRDHDRDSDHYEDEVYVFFMNCYHLKDWLKHDTAFSGGGAVEAFINATPDLQICADICNAHKHLKLTKPPRSTEQPEMGARMFSLSLGSGPPEIGVKYTIDTVSGPMDAYELAGRCVKIWSDFIAAHEK